MEFEQVQDSTVPESNFEMPQSENNMESIQNSDLNQNFNFEEMNNGNNMNNLNDMNNYNDMNIGNANMDFNNMMNVPIDEEEQKRLEEREKEQMIQNMKEMM
jgi:hypothetical protein